MTPEEQKKAMKAVSDTLDEQARKITYLELENLKLKEQIKDLKNNKTAL